MELTRQDLQNAYSLPRPKGSSQWYGNPNALQWLGNARITVIPEGPAEMSFEYSPTGPWLPKWFYHATIHLEDGTDLTIHFGHGPRYMEWNVQVHWPGAAGYERLW